MFIRASENRHVAFCLFLHYKLDRMSTNLQADLMKQKNDFFGRDCQSTGYALTGCDEIRFLSGWQVHTAKPVLTKTKECLDRSLDA